MCLPTILLTRSLLKGTIFPGYICVISAKYNDQHIIQPFRVFEEWMEEWTHLMRILEGGDKLRETTFLHLLKSRTKYLLKNISNHNQNTIVLELECFIFTSSSE